MEANRNRSRGFLRGKLSPFLYRAPKPSPTLQYTTTNVQPNHSSPSPASVGYVVHKDYAITQPTNPKVSIVVADSFWGDGLIMDHDVDTKAALYISMVQQRLMLEQVQEN